LTATRLQWKALKLWGPKVARALLRRRICDACDAVMAVAGWWGWLIANLIGLRFKPCCQNILQKSWVSVNIQGTPSMGLGR
jgi:hypothetical protein